MPTRFELPTEAALDEAVSVLAEAGERDTPAAPDRYIRVQADRLDAVINLLGELVIAGAGATLLARETRQTGLVEANLAMNSLIEEIRNGTLALRMVPVADTFSTLRRVVHDTATRLGKAVNFEIVGAEVELDKSVVEKIAEPLGHLVQHALAHDLEPSHERLVAGKPAVGQLTLRAQHETGAILICLESDGRGVACEPDSSLAAVQSHIDALRGSLHVTRHPGCGLQVDIRLPLTLAIIDGFMVGVGKSKFVLPLASVVEVIEAGDQTVRVDADGRHCLTLRGAVLPVVRLRTLYTVPSSHTDRVSVVVVNAPRGPYGIEVEVLLGQQQTVIKPLGRLFKTLRGISGSSILGSGEVALILDVVSLGELVINSAQLSTSAMASVAA